MKRESAAPGRNPAPLDLVAARSHRYLRTATVLLLVVTAMAASVVVYLQRAHEQQQRDFAENSNLRLVTVTHRVGVDGAFEVLGAKDAGVITKILADVGAGSATVSNVYALGGGLSTETDRALVVYGVDRGMAEVFGLTSVEDGTGYIAAEPTGRTTLRIPVVSVGPDGYDSGPAVDHQITLVASLDRQKADFILSGDVDQVMLVNTETFAGIAEKMLGAAWPDVLQRWERGELPLTPLISEIGVYVPDIRQVRQSAEALERRGYATSYGLQAFDGVEGRLRLTTILGGMVAIALLGAASTYLFLSWRSYLRLSRRDIGILRHWAVPEVLLEQLYQRRLTRDCLAAWGVGLLIAVVGAPLLLGLEAGLPWAAANALVLTVGLALVRELVIRFAIRPVVRVDVLTLLKRDREFQ